MNRPDEKTLSSWLEGELEGEELRKVDTWAETHVGELDEEFKREIGWCALNDELMASLPDSEEPPYPEFFNSKIEQAISEVTQHGTLSEPSSPPLWQKIRLMIAPAAFAAMVAFYAGTQMQNEKPADIPAVASEQSSVYVPNNGIVAAVSESNDATEIILSGLTPISDELDIASGDTSPGRSPMMASTPDEVNPYNFF
jgi:hypothetical protein